jgi:hypothetical protein
MKTRKVITMVLTFILLISFIAADLEFVSYAADTPQPISPSYGETITAIDVGSGMTAPPVAVPEFRWSAVDGATQYRIQFSPQVGFNTIPLDIVTPHTNYIPTNVGIFTEGEWYWRVRVEQSPDGQSPYSFPQLFYKQWAHPLNKPVLNVPLDGVSLDFYSTPIFSWESIMGGAQYRFQIATSPDFSQPALRINQTTLANTYQPNQKLANGLYYWRVIPVDPSGREGTPSDYRTFNQNYDHVPVLIEPANNLQPVFTPTFRWEAMRGASQYRLQYSTSPTFDSGLVTINTHNTSFTPTSPLPNDQNYYWRVKTLSGAAESEWSETRTFIKRWYIKAQPLTPTNNYQHIRFPLFSWTPVPGAAHYRIDYSPNIGFSPPVYTETTSNTFYTPRVFFPASSPWYWRITPFDSANNAGRVSDVFSFVSYGDAIAPTLIYPFPYYLPDNYGDPFQNVFTNPYEDRTVPLPIFLWHRVTDLGSIQQPYNAYRIQVASDDLFNNIAWQSDTENLAAAPTTSNPFAPQNNTDYFWRVCHLDDLGGSCATPWSQIWRTRFNLNLGLVPQSSITPIRPVQAAEIVETTPMLEWWPVANADSYDVQISTDPGFAAQYIVDSALVSYPVFTPATSLAQRSLGRTPFLTYYWRARARQGGSPFGDWSDTRYFTIAAQSQWKQSRTPGDPENHLIIGTDPVGDQGNSNYDLSTLTAAQDKDYWYAGFKVHGTSGGNMTYALYLDTNHLINLGGPNDPRGYNNVSTANIHHPEFAIYVDQVSESFNAAQVFIYEWDRIINQWMSPRSLASVGGSLDYDNVAGHLELRLPNTAIGMSDETGSYAISLFSIPTAGGLPQDTVPSDPNATNNGYISRFASVSERNNLRYPLDDGGIDPATFPSIPPMFWDYSLGAPWTGARSETYLDELYTTVIGNYVLESNTWGYSPPSYTWLNDFSQGDNTFFWRVKNRYLLGGNIQFGAWSKGARYERWGFVPQNLVESVTFATPTFAWDRVEGALSYDLVVDNDPTFASPEININTSEPQYTPTTTLANAQYHWRVRVRRRGNVFNQWGEVKVFSLSLPQPTGLVPHDPAGTTPVRTTPTLCWDPLIQLDTQGTPVLAAYRYQVQISRDANFSPIYEQIETEQNCFTPTRGYDDGRYYWRVAMKDGRNLNGEFSPTATFVKQYRVTTLVSPIGAVVPGTPKFVWTPVDNAASYRLQVSQSPTFSPIYEEVTTHNTSFMPTRLYQSNRLYYWRVAIIDREGKIGPYTDATLIIDPTGGAFKIYLPTLRK